jgi:hypothetical protein
MNISLIRFLSLATKISLVKTIKVIFFDRFLLGSHHHHSSLMCNVRTPCSLLLETPSSLGFQGTAYTWFSLWLSSLSLYYLLFLIWHLHWVPGLSPWIIYSAVNSHSFNTLSQSHDFKEYSYVYEYTLAPPSSLSNNPLDGVANLTKEKMPNKTGLIGNQLIIFSVSICSYICRLCLY